MAGSAHVYEGSFVEHVRRNRFLVSTACRSGNLPSRLSRQGLASLHQLESNYPLSVNQPVIFRYSGGMLRHYGSPSAFD